MIVFVKINGKVTKMAKFNRRVSLLRLDKLILFKEMLL